ncbi:MAG: EamA family transporter [Clostridia bacterium]|nr:EamA family transporter [Clostridia bacterium]
MKKYLGEASVLSAALLWGTIGFFTRNLSSLGFSSVGIVAVRSFFTALAMFIIIAVKDIKLLHISLKDIWMFLGTGIASFMFFNICYMSSITENSLSVACILMYTSPVWVSIISYFVFKEKFNKIKVLSLVICLSGCVLTCLSSTLKLTKIGLIYGILSGIGYALYSIFGKIASKKYNSYTIVFYTFLFSFAALLPFCNAPGIIAKTSSIKTFALLVSISIINTLLPYLLYTFGLSRIDAGKASVISIIEPVASAVTGLIFFGEVVGIQGIIGIVFVIIGIYLLSFKSDNNT